MMSILMRILNCELYMPIIITTMRRNTQHLVQGKCQHSLVYSLIKKWIITETGHWLIFPNYKKQNHSHLFKENLTNKRNKSKILFRGQIKRSFLYTTKTLPSKITKKSAEITKYCLEIIQLLVTAGWRCWLQLGGDESFKEEHKPVLVLVDTFKI